MSSPAVSVVLPFLNGERFIGEAIKSVLAQSWSDLELILVDDGSADSSGSIARSYAVADPRVRLVAHPGNSNRGVAASRNLGAAVALAPRIAFIDADDRWPPWKLTEQAAIMDRHPEIGLLAGATRYWRSWEGGTDTVKLIGAVNDRVIEPPTALLTTYPLGRAEAPAPSSFMLTAQALARVGGFEEDFVGRYGFYEDQAFLVKVYLRENVFFSSRCWLDYRQHCGSALASGLRRGDYVEVRAHFLNWFERQLAARGTVNRQIVRRIRWARAKNRLTWIRQSLEVTLGRGLSRSD